ncbi:Uncharacterised protein [uncultured archaeon]|nr:Uncharacterised protein [uncultured archaeon]
MQKQDIVDFLHGLSNSLLQGFGDVQKHSGLGNEIAEGIEKSRKKLFTIGVSIALAGIGFFLILWGIASTIDTIFAMRGFGFVLVGIIAVLAGALAYKR